MTSSPSTRTTTNTREYSAKRVGTSADTAIDVESMVRGGNVQSYRAASTTSKPFGEEQFNRGEFQAPPISLNEFFVLANETVRMDGKRGSGIFTQSQFAQFIGNTDSYVSQVLRGGKPWTIELALRFVSCCLFYGGGPLIMRMGPHDGAYLNGSTLDEERAIFHGATDFGRHSDKGQYDKACNDLAAIRRAANIAELELELKKK